MSRVWNFIRQEAVLCGAALAALITCFFVPPSAAYLTYLDGHVLTLLFCLMLVVAGLRKTGFFDALAHAALRRANTVRALGTLLVLLCFFSSMIITNDVALITFVPFAILVLRAIGREDCLPYIVSLQTIAANLGSALTPLGNPQNLYLYSVFHMTARKFFSITLPVTLLGLAAVCVLCLFIRRDAVSTANQQQATAPVDGRRTALYFALFALCLCSVFRLIGNPLLLVLICVTVLAADRTLFAGVDYGLLLTFVFFFIFVGNMKAIPAVGDALSGLVAGHELPWGVLLSQVISNVPAAVMLSPFTANAAALIIGVNVGGLGSLVASLASLISFRLYGQSGKKAHYLVVFTVMNLVVLVFLLAVVLLTGLAEF